MELTLDSILALPGPSVAVPLPVCKVVVYVRTLSAADMEAVWAVAQDESKAKGHYLAAYVVAMSMCDADGRRLCTSSDQDVERVKGMAVADLFALFDAARLLNGMDAKDAEKNSGSIQGSDSGTGSPSPLDAPSGNSSNG